jgi:positive regulator of sigma E activity
MTKQEAYSSSLFLGVCAALLSALFTDQNHIIGFSLLSTFGGYLFLRKQSVKSYLPAMAGAAALLLWKFSMIHILLVGISSLLCVMYQLPYGVSLRNNGILKPISIAFAWTLNTVLLASANQFEFIPNDHSVVFSSVSIFVLTFFLALYYDLKDAHEDEHKNSIAVKLGPNKTFKYAIISMLVLLLVGIVYFKGITKETVALSGATAYILFIHSKVIKGKGSTYIIDSCYILYALIFLACKHLIQ